MNSEKIVLSIDPGKIKCGIAIVDNKNKVYFRKVIEKGKLKEEVKNLLRIYKFKLVILGNKTASKEVEKILKEFKNLKIILEREDYTSEKSRKRYFKENPPKGIRKILSLSLQTPPEPYDDYAAIILAEEYFKRKETN